MKDTVTIILAIFVAAILLFILPLIAVSEKNNALARGTAEKAVKDFVSESATVGTVTMTNYQKLINKLGTTRNTFEVEMEVAKIDDNIGKKTQWTNNTIIGENSTVTVYTNEIMNALQDKGVYHLRSGDRFTVKVKNKNKTMAQNFRNILFGSNNVDNYDIVAQDSQNVTASGRR